MRGLVEVCVVCLAGFLSRCSVACLRFDILGLFSFLALSTMYIVGASDCHAGSAAPLVWSIGLRRNLYAIFSPTWMLQFCVRDCFLLRLAFIRLLGLHFSFQGEEIVICIGAEDRSHILHLFEIGHVQVSIYQGAIVSTIPKDDNLPGGGPSPLVHS